MTKMKRKLYVLLAVIMVLSMLSIPALASPPDNNASGDWCYALADGTDVKEAGGNIFVLDFNDEGHWFGTFSGYSFDEGRIVMRDRGYWVFNTTVSFDEVTVLGKTGGLEMRVNGWIPADWEDFSEYEGMWVITRATGELRGLRGRGTWDGGPTTDCGGDYPYGVPYVGTVHFRNE
jgi:hypothetical protein